MSKFNIARVARGLTTYAIERQHSFERHQPDGLPPWAEQRRFWTDAILQGMARLDGEQPDSRLMEQFDLELEQARGCYFFVPATAQMQRDTILELRRFVAALEATGDDRRRQIAVVGDLLEDIGTHRSWGLAENGLSRAWEEAESALVRMTARMPIRFTRILLGGDAGTNWVSSFVSGCVKDAEAVKQTAVYQDAVQTYPEVVDWPALCTVYVGRGLPSALGTVDASSFDLEIMNRTGDRFLRERGVRCVGGPYQMTVSNELSMTTQCSQKIVSHDQTAEPSERGIRVLKIEPGMAPEIVTMPNTLDALQAAVGGYIETVTLDANLILVCNEEGKLNGLPANRQVGGDTIAGTVLVVGAEDGDFASLSDADAAYYAEKFAQPMPSYTTPDEPAPWKFYVL